jgi:DNA-binding CsgD family transcriptional regulator
LRRRQVGFQKFFRFSAHTAPIASAFIQWTMFRPGSKYVRRGGDRGFGDRVGLPHSPPWGDEGWYRIRAQYGFSRRQMDYLWYACHGLDERQIAERLTRSFHTVHKLGTAIRARMGVSNLANMILTAMEVASGHPPHEPPPP